MKKQILLLIAMLFAFGNVLCAQDFSTGSDMMTTGSAYSSTVTGVGATGVNDMYSTSETPSTTTRPGARKLGGETIQPGEGATEEEHPIGSDAVLFFFAAVAAGVVALRRRRQA